MEVVSALFGVVMGLIGACFLGFGAVLFPFAVGRRYVCVILAVIGMTLVYLGVQIVVT